MYLDLKLLELNTLIKYKSKENGSSKVKEWRLKGISPGRTSQKRPKSRDSAGWALGMREDDYHKKLS